MMLRCRASEPSELEVAMLTRLPEKIDGFFHDRLQDCVTRRGLWGLKALYYHLTVNLARSLGSDGMWEEKEKQCWATNGECMIRGVR